MNNIKREYKGDIVLGTEVMVSDPCYGLGTWCQGVVNNVVPGKYNCTVEYCYDNFWGTRVSAIDVINESYNANEIDYVETNFEVGVDSGQAGIFDYIYYVKHHENESGARILDDDWYDKVCNITIAKESSGTIDGNGLVSSSGYGDGLYWCYVAYDIDDKIIAIRIEFITEDDGECYDD